MNIIHMNITVDITLDFSLLQSGQFRFHLSTPRGLDGKTRGSSTSRCSGQFSVPSFLQSFKLLSNLKPYVNAGLTLTQLNGKNQSQ